MRKRALAPVMLALAALTACTQEPRLPQIAQGTPYAEVRLKMISAGFIPQRFSQRVVFDGGPPHGPEFCPIEDQQICATWPEAFECSNGMQQRCRWLYRAGRTGRFASVTTRCTEFGRFYCFEAVLWEDMTDREGFIVAGPAIPLTSSPP